MLQGSPEQPVYNTDLQHVTAYLRHLLAQNV
jgi:hypothetical protein